MESPGGLLDGALTWGSIVGLRDFNAHVGNNSETWKGLVGRNGLPDLNPNGILVSDFYAMSQFVRKNTIFKHNVVHGCTGHRNALGWRSMINLFVMSSSGELIHWQGKILERLSRPKHVARASWERLVEPCVSAIFNADLRKSFSQIPEEVRDTESEGPCSPPLLSMQLFSAGL